MAASPGLAEIPPYLADARLRAAVRAWRDSACFDAAERPSRFSAFVDARDRFAEGLWSVPDWPLR